MSRFIFEQADRTTLQRYARECLVSDLLVRIFPLLQILRGKDCKKKRKELAVDPLSNILLFSAIVVCMF